MLSLQAVAAPPAARLARRQRGGGSDDGSGRSSATCLAHRCMLRLYLQPVLLETLPSCSRGREVERAVWSTCNEVGRGLGSPQSCRGCLRTSPVNLEPRCPCPTLCNSLSPPPPPSPPPTPGLVFYLDASLKEPSLLPGITCRALAAAAAAAPARRPRSSPLAARRGRAVCAAAAGEDKVVHLVRHGQTEMNVALGLLPKGAR